jgi:hypothetical protein
MNFITISAGAIVSAIGVYTFYKSIKSPEKVLKLQAMRRMLGNVAGTTIYTIAYSILPMVFGGFAVNAGINGASIMQFISAQ